VSLPERNPLPESLANEAAIPGIKNARYWADERPPYTAAWFDLSKDQLAARYPSIFGSTHNYLAISGGGPRSPRGY
jgi:hypothetical protein